MASDKTMHRGVQQALYKYLPENWVDFTQSGGSLTYAVHVDNWNSVQLMGINNKRLLRVVNQQIKEYKNLNGDESVVGFPSEINEDYVDVLTPKISDNIAAIQTSVKPWVFVCKKCGHVRQYYSYDEFKRREHERCKCGENLTQLRMIRVCKCGYADGVFVPKCKTPGHGTKYMIRKGSGLDFVCTACGQRASLPHYCPECKQELKIKPALDSSNYIPFSLSLIDLLDKKKDVFLDAEKDGRGEKVVIAQYLDLISKESYKEIIEKGKVTQSEKFEKALQKKADDYRAMGLDEVTINTVLDAERRMNPGNQIFDAINKVSTGISVESSDDLKTIAEEILEYDELIDAKITLSLDKAEEDASIVNDGIKLLYRGLKVSEYNIFIEADERKQLYKNYSDSFLADRVRKSEDKIEDIEERVFKDNKGELLAILWFAKTGRLIKRILEIGAYDNSVILDFFAGSGTTAQAVMEYNCSKNTHLKYIMCTNNENNICNDVTYPRIKTVISGKREDGGKYSDSMVANLKYYRTDFVSRDEEFLADELLKHITEMIQLEHGVNIDDKQYVMVLSDEEADELQRHWNEYQDIKAIYISRKVLLTTEQNMLFGNTEIHIIPDDYFEFELKEEGQAW